MPVFLPVLLLFFLIFRKTFLYNRELPHDIIPATRSDDNRRTAGAVGHLALGFHYEQTKSIENCRPGGEALVSSRGSTTIWVTARLLQAKSINAKKRAIQSDCPLMTT